MIDKLPIKTLLDAVKQPFIPYTTAKSVRWDGTDKTLYDVVMEGVPVPETSTEYLSTTLLENNNNDNPIVLEDLPKGIYCVPYGGSSRRFTLYFKWYASESYVSTLSILDGMLYKYADGLTPDEHGLLFVYTDTSGVLNFCEDVRGYRQGAKFMLADKSTNITARHTYEQLPIAYANLTPTADNQFVFKGYVDGAITSAIEENNTGLNADIMVAINAAGRAEMQVEQKVDIANIDLSNQTTTLLSKIKALGPAGIDYARFYTTTDGGSSGISDKPTGPTNAGFACEVFCNRRNNESDYRYVVICWVQSTAQPYVATVDATTTMILWNQLAAKTAVDAKQNKVTYGTGDPSGGSDGDVYFKYTA